MKFNPAYTYLLLDAFTLLGPLMLSFDKRVAFFRKWKHLFPAMLLPGAFFIAVDVWFTHIGVWGFNDTYILGPRLFGLPPEEWLFFLSVPYACVFIYECLNAYVPRDWFARSAKAIAYGLMVLNVVLAIVFYDRMYTAFYFSALAIFLVVLLATGLPPWMGRFFMMYVVHLVPLWIVNGVLTALPVVWYNDAENMGLRVPFMPAEDTMYSMLLLLMIVTIYEYLSARQPLTHTKFTPRHAQP